MKRILLFLIILTISKGGYSANYYWRATAINNLFTNVGNWETSPSNGISPATAPSATDDVFFPVTSNFSSINLNGGVAQNFNFTAPTIFTFTGTGNFYGSLNANGNARFSGQVNLLGNTVKNINLDPIPGTTVYYFTGGTLSCNAGTINLLHNLYHNGAVNIVSNAFNSNGNDIVVTSGMEINNVNGDYSGSLLDCGYRFRIRSYAANNYNMSGARIVLRSTFENVNFITNYANHSPLRVLGGKLLNFQSLKLVDNKTLYGASGAQISVDSLILDCNKMQVVNLTSITANNLVLQKPSSIYNISYNTYNIGDVVTPVSCKGSSIFYGASRINTLASITNSDINFNGINFTGVGYNASSSNNLGNNWGAAITWGGSLSGKIFYWVGGAGSWENPTEWSLLGSGGAPQTTAGCIPTFADSVVFDNNSFASVGDLVNTQNTSAMCKSISVVDTDIEGNFNGTINIAGNADFSGANAVNSINLLGSGSHTLNSGNTLTYSGSIVFRMEGTYTLVSRLYTSGIWQHYSGSFVSDGFPINVLSWVSTRLNNNFSSRNINIENSIIDINGSGGAIAAWRNIDFSNSSLNSLLTSNSVIRVNSNGNGVQFRTQGAPSLVSPTFNNLVFTLPNGTGRLSAGGYVFNNITWNNNGNSDAGGYTVDTIHLTSGKNYTFLSNNTFNVNNINTLSNACDELAVVSSSGGAQTRFFKSVGPFNGNNLMINNVNANGATLNVIGGIDNGGLTNVVVTPATGRDLYWVGDAGNWNDGLHWSIGVSGGNPAITNPSGCIPRPIDNVFFDTNSFTVSGQTITLNIDGNCKNIVWDTNAGSFNPIFSGGTGVNLNVYGSLEISDGVTHNHSGDTYLRGTDISPLSNIIKTNSVLFRSTLRPAGGGRYDFTSDHIQAGTAGLYPVSPGGFVVTNGYRMRFGVMIYGGIAASIGLSGVNKLDVRNSTIELSRTYGGGVTAYINNIRKNVTFFSNDSTIFKLNSYASWANSDIRLYSSTSDTVEIGEMIFGPPARGILLTTNFFKFKKVQFTQNNTSINGAGTIITDTLIFGQSTTNTIESNKTIWVNDSLVAFGTPCVPLTLRSSSAGTPATLVSGVCNMNLEFASLRDINASLVTGCLATQYNVIGNDLGGNTNWTFSSIASLTQLGNDTTVYCTEAPYTINTDGFGSVPASYLWNTGDTTATIEVDTSGIYSVNVNYASGCNVIDTVVVTVIDTVAPVLTCPLDSTVYLNGICQYVLGDFTDSVAVDDCTPDSALILTQLPLPGTVYSGESIQTIWIYAEDNYGNIDSCSFQLTLLDTLNPTITCNDTTIYLNALGTYSIDTSYVFANASDNCGVDSIWITPTNYTCVDTGLNIVTLYVRDNNNNVDSCTANVTVLDTLNPVVTCKDTTVYLNALGTYTIDTSYVFVNASDNCGVDSIWITPTNYTCADIGLNTVTVYVRDNNNNLDSCIANVTVLDTINPIVVCNDTTIYLNVSGTYTIDTSYVFANASDNCGVDSIWITTNTFNCADTGVNTVTVYARDNNNNIDSCIANVTVLDTINPIVVCNDTTIYLNATGQYTIDTSYVFTNASDNCGVDSIWINTTDTLFTCTDTGVNTVTVYVRDNNNNLDSCIANVTVLDTINPIITCKDTTIYLNATGTYTIDTSYVFVNASDNCGVDSIWITTNTFTCTNTGVNTVTVYARDNNNNVDSCIANVTVLDTLNPIVTCKDTTIYLNASGTYTIDTSYVFVNATDNCGLDNVWITNTSFTCANTGINIVTIYARDVNNNIDSCQAQVTVLDTINPTALCKDTLVYLDGTGSYVIDSSYINNGSYDACGIQTITLSKTIFTCLDTGLNTVTVYVRDNNNNVDSCIANVTVLDTLNPVVTCKDTTVYLNTLGTYTIDTSYLFVNASDNCGVDSIWIITNTFNCTNTGLNTVTVYARDNNNNVDSCIANVTVIDSINPTLTCQDTTIYLDATGQYTIDTSYVFTNASDNCGVNSVWITTNTFTCADTGLNTVTVYVRDNNNNVDSCIANVTVLDTINPIITCQDTTIYLNASGTYTIDTSYVFVNASDNCGIDSIWIITNTFTCADTGLNTVIVYVRDNNNNIDSCIANVTVLDTIPPTVVCNDTTIYLGINGQYIIDTSYIFTNANDNCSIDSIWTNDTLYTCANIGTTQATIYVRDASGNIDSCVANVTVMDTLTPTVTCQDTTIYLSPAGTYTIDTSYVLANLMDNCTLDSVWLTPTSFTCADTGLNTVKIYARDVNNNLDSCTANVIVLDTVNPTISCQNATVYLDTNGQFIIDTSYVYSSAFAGCGLDSVWIVDSVFDCSRIGVNTVSVYARDINGNVDSCQAQVTVVDSINPQITCGSTLYDTVSNACEYIVPDFRTLTLPTDNCTDSISFQITQVPAPGTVITVQDQQIETITITVTDTNGNATVCMFDVELTCSDEFQIPEFISPNGDGKNDTWIITGIDAYPNNNVKIFNRYGAMVYQTNGYHNQWDGTANVDYIFQSGESDNILPSGTYFYRIELDVNNKQSEVYTGMVQLQK